MPIWTAKAVAVAIDNGNLWDFTHPILSASWIGHFFGFFPYSPPYFRKTLIFLTCLNNRLFWGKAHNGDRATGQFGARAE
ncbi:hypothetical protein QUB60_00945 [Microcoleus sp. A2-C5]|uniref:hypothetical protein n=1 Tax=unclassified Microcoleus TaxID=2642155 RepID=UPI002FD47BD2